MTTPNAWYVLVCRDCNGADDNGTSEPLVIRFESTYQRAAFTTEHRGSAPDHRWFHMEHPRAFPGEQLDSELIDIDHQFHARPPGDHRPHKVEPPAGRNTYLVNTAGDTVTQAKGRICIDGTYHSFTVDHDTWTWTTDP